MPDPIVIDGCWKVESYFSNSVAENSWSNVWFVEGGAGATVAELDDFATAFVGIVGSAFLGYMCSDTIHVIDVVSDVNTDTGAQGTATDGTNGTDDAHACQYDQCTVITWNTGLRGRSKRGRSYLRGWAIDKYAGTNGERLWSSGHVTDMQTQGAAFIAGLTDAGHPLVVAHRATHDYDVVTTCQARAGIFSQRRTSQPSG